MKKWPTCWASPGRPCRAGWRASSSTRANTWNGAPHEPSFRAEAGTAPARSGAFPHRRARRRVRPLPGPPSGDGEAGRGLPPLRLPGDTGRRFPAALDAPGRVSSLYAQEVRGDVARPGGIRLDGNAGPERFFAVCDRGYDAVERAVREIGPSVRQKNALPDVQGPQASLLIEKKP